MILIPRWWLVPGKSSEIEVWSLLKLGMDTGAGGGVERGDLN